MNRRRRAMLEGIASQLADLRAALSVVMTDEQDAFENMPEGLQQGTRGQQMGAAIEQLETAADALDEAAEALTEAVSA